MSNNLHQFIPGGCHTYSKGDDQYPSNAPKILERGNGAYVYDENNEEYLDYGMGLRSISLGYGKEEIITAAMDGILKGNNLSRPSTMELSASRKMLELNPWADMVKFAKNGSNVTTAAIKLSRAYNNKTHVLLCEDHPFFSFDDWFINSTPIKRGTLDQPYIKFKYNDFESLTKIFEENYHLISCIILEPITVEHPKTEKESNFLQHIRNLCDKYNVVYILDEMITGFRYEIGGVSSRYSVIPDLSTFGKAIANGFSLSALVGKKEIMELGGIIKENEERVFLLSSTHGAEMSSLSAFLGVVEFYKNNNVVSRLSEYGKNLIDGANKISEELGLQDYFYFYGFPESPAYICKNSLKEICLKFRTLFLQEMVKNKILITYVAISYSHKEKELEKTLSAIRKSLQIYKLALEEGIEKYLEGRPIKPVFRKYN